MAVPIRGLKSKICGAARLNVDSVPLIRLSEWIRKDHLQVCSLLVVKGR